MAQPEWLQSTETSNHPEWLAPTASDNTTAPKHPEWLQSSEQKQEETKPVDMKSYLEAADKLGFTSPHKMVFEGLQSFATKTAAMIPAGLSMLSGDVELGRKVQDKLTYEPSTAGGKLVASALSYPLELVGQILHKGGEYTQDAIHFLNKIGEQAQAGTQKLFGLSVTGLSQEQKERAEQLEIVVPTVIETGANMLLGEILRGTKTTASAVVDGIKNVHEFVKRSEDGLATKPEPVVPDVQKNSPMAGVGGQQGGAVSMEAVGALAEASKKGIDTINTFLKETQDSLKASADFDNGIWTLEQRQVASGIRAVKLMENVRDIYSLQDVIPQEGRYSLSDSLEKIYKYDEDVEMGNKNPEQLTEVEKHIYDTIVTPLKKSLNEMVQALMDEGLLKDIDKYNPRKVASKGGLFDRFMGATKVKLSGGGVLRVSADSFKRRSMMAMEDAAGNREIISVKGGDVTAWDKKTPTHMGEYKLKTNQQLLDKELQDHTAKTEKLQKEQKILEEQVSKIKGDEPALVAARSVVNDRLVDLAEEQETHEEIGNRIRDKYNPATLNEHRFVDKDGKAWKLDQATTDEIEQNTHLTYHKNVVANYAAAYVDAARAIEARNFLENYKNSPEFYTIAMKIGENNPPKGWRATNLRQFSGYYFDPKVAAAMDRYQFSIDKGGDPLALLTGMNNFLKTTIFLNPFMHLPNVAFQWGMEKGISGWLNPAAYPRMWRTGWKAFNAIKNMDENALYAYDHGAPLMAGKDYVDKLHSMLLDKAETELKSNPQLRFIADKLGYLNPYKLAHKVTWPGNDMFFLQATFERMERDNLNFDDAYKKVAEIIPSYRVPALVMNSRAVSYIMTNQNLTMFGPYHYGILSSFGHAMKDLVSKVPIEKRAVAADRLAQLGLMTLVVYPVLDHILKRLTDRQDAEMKRSGIAKPLKDIYDMTQGQKDLADVVNGMVTPAPASKEILDQMRNFDSFTHKPIREDKTPIMDSLEHAAKAVAPIEQGAQVFGVLGNKKSKTGSEWWLNQAGVNFPKTRKHK